MKKHRIDRMISAAAAAVLALGSYSGISVHAAANIAPYSEAMDQETLRSEFLAATDNGAEHPRLIADTEDFERIAAEVRTDPVKSEWYSQVIYTANSILNEEPAEYAIKDGRLLDQANAALLRVEYMGFAYRITGETQYAERGIEELEAICSFPDWNPDHFLDTGTLASAAAIGYDWLYDAMDDGERSLIAVRSRKLAIEPALEAYRGEADFNSFWTDTETNWGVVVNGGIANLALATGEYNTETAMEALSFALESIKTPLGRIAPDGAWYEGPDYWSYLLTHLSLFMGSYETAMGEPFAKDTEGLDKYGWFQAYLTGPDGLPNNFHDADEETVNSDGQFYLADLYNDTALMEYRIGFMKENSIRPSVMDIIWCRAGLTGNMSGAETETDSYFRETEFVSMRSGWERDDAWVSFHGGYSNNAHDHVDPGTFVFCLGGVRWAIDLGTEPMSYLPDSQNPAVQAGYNSYYFYRRKGEGHNVLVIDPDAGLETDQSAFAKASEPSEVNGASFSAIDLSDAYAEDVYSYQRGYRLSDNKRTLTVRDELTLRSSSVMHWYMHTRGDIEIIDSNTAIITQSGKRLLVRFADNGNSSRLQAAAAESLQTSPQFANTENTGVTKLDYEVTGIGSVDITVQLSLIGETGSMRGMDTSSIAEWRSGVSTEAEYTLANREALAAYDYSLSEIPALGGRSDGETAYAASVTGVPADAGAEPGFELPFYANRTNSEGKVRTLELSFRYDESAPSVKLASYISAHQSSWAAMRVAEFVRFKDGRIYVNGADTGLAARDGEWFRIVVEEHYNASETRVLINGNEFDPGLEDYIFGNRWTQIGADMSDPGDGSARDISVVIRDVICYEGSYIENGGEKASFRCYNRDMTFDNNERTLTVSKAMTADALCAEIITGGTAGVISPGGGYIGGPVLDGDVLVLTSADGKSCGYYYISAPENRLRLYRDGVETDVLSEGMLRAEAAANGEGEGILIMAVYRNGELSEVITDTGTIDGRTAFSAETALESTEGVSVKLMLWDENMRPYFDSAVYR